MHLVYMFQSLYVKSQERLKRPALTDLQKCSAAIIWKNNNNKTNTEVTCASALKVKNMVFIRAGRNSFIVC